MTSGASSLTPAPSFRELVRADALALGGGPRSTLFYLAAALGLSKFSAVFLYRLSARLAGRSSLAGIVSAAAYRLNAVVNSCEISPGAKIGPGLHLPHPLGIVVGPIRAGSLLTLLQNVTIGLRDRSATHGDTSVYPILGDGVQIGPGAVLIGPIRVGNDAKIGANAVVLDDVPVGGIALGSKANIRMPAEDGPSVG